MFPGFLLNLSLFLSSAGGQTFGWPSQSRLRRASSPKGGAKSRLPPWGEVSLPKHDGEGNPPSGAHVHWWFAQARRSAAAQWRDLSRAARTTNDLFILARYPAPKPLSIFTTLTPLAQEFSMDSSAARPQRPPRIPRWWARQSPAIGQAADDAGQGPLHPGDGDDDPGAHNVLQVGEGAVQPGHAHVVQAGDLVAQHFAVRAASSATGMSLVPPVATTMVPLPWGRASPPQCRCGPSRGS